MNDLIVLENYVDAQCVRHVHLMSNLPIEECVQLRYAPAGVGNLVKEIGTYHFRAEYPYRGVLDVQAACSQGKARRLVVWNLQGCESVKAALAAAVQKYEQLFGGKPEFAFMNRLPRVVEHGQDVGDLTLLEADWMLEKCVAVGRKS